MRRSVRKSRSGARHRWVEQCIGDFRILIGEGVSVDGRVYQLPADIWVSVDSPGTPRCKGTRVPAQIFYPPSDGEPWHIFVSSELEQSFIVCGALLHALIHAMVGD